jgi:tetratricopeptide (TPR) repeat protein
MRPSTSDHPRVFISYSHDSREHMDGVLDLSNRLRTAGIDCHIDQYEESPPEGWPQWTLNQFEAADFVLVVCTENYERRFRGKEAMGTGLGVKWEGAIITQELYDAENRNTTFIPVFFSPEDSAYAPIVLRGATRYILSSEEDYEALYRRLTQQPLTQKPALGSIRPMPPLARKQPLVQGSSIFESHLPHEKSLSETATATPEENAKRVWKKLPVLGAGALLLLVLCASFVARWLWRTAPMDASSLISTYQALERGEWAQADALFQQLAEQRDKRMQSQGYAGLAALALARRDFQQALALAGQAEATDPEIAYTHVVRGDLLMQQGKVAEAMMEYRTATEKAQGAAWQYAIADNQLGRIYAVQGDVPRALEHYDRAISRDQRLAVAYANKGQLLEKINKPREALGLYRQALQLNPDDRLTQTLLHEIERRQKLTQDKEKQERIDQLVSELIRSYQEGKRRESPGDGWTSKPLTLALLDVRMQGTLPSRAGEEEFLLLRMAQGLQVSGRIAIVERAILDKLLEELKLSASDLTDPQIAVRVGRILAARLVATGSFTRFGNEGQLGIRVIETETTRIKASVVEPVSPPRGIDEVVGRVSNVLLQQVLEAYPLQGLIAQVTPEGVIVNIGTEQGLTSGRILQVFGTEEAIERDGKIVGYRGRPVGLIEATNVEATLSQARVLEQTAPFQTGWKVKEGQRN